MKSLWLTLALGVTLSGMNTVNAREQTPAPASGPVDATAADDSACNSVVAFIVLSSPIRIRAGFTAGLHVPMLPVYRK